LDEQSHMKGTFARESAREGTRESPVEGTRIFRGQGEGKFVQKSRWWRCRNADGPGIKGARARRGKRTERAEGDGV